MSIVADFSVPSEAFCLGESLQAAPDVTAELDRLVAHSPDYVMPFVWILDADDAFDDALARDPSVETAEITDRFDTARLYQFTWTDVVADRLHLILDHEGVILEARGCGDEWLLSVRFGSQDQFSEFQRHFEKFGEISLHRTGSPEAPGGKKYGVTEKQRETLLAALESGYFETGRGAALDELGDQFDISKQAVSNRLKLGTRSLIESTLDRHRID